MTYYFFLILRHNETGEEQVIKEKISSCDSYEKAAHLLEFMYSEGNYSCDCNRHMFFNRAKGIDVDNDRHACNEGWYTVTYSTFGYSE